MRVFSSLWRDAHHHLEPRRVGGKLAEQITPARQPEIAGMPGWLTDRAQPGMGGMGRGRCGETSQADTGALDKADAPTRLEAAPAGNCPGGDRRDESRSDRLGQERRVEPAAGDHLDERADGDALTTPAASSVLRGEALARVCSQGWTTDLEERVRWPI